MEMFSLTLKLKGLAGEIIGFDQMSAFMCKSRNIFENAFLYSSKTKWNTLQERVSVAISLTVFHLVFQI